jgi:hypothetical protein
MTKIETEKHIPNIILTEIPAQKLPTEITEFEPIECLDCNFDSHIPINYYLVRPEIQNEQQYLNLKKFVNLNLGFESFTEMSYEDGLLISVTKCPRCLSEDIIQDF